MRLKHTIGIWLVDWGFTLMGMGRNTKRGGRARVEMAKVYLEKPGA